MIVTDGIDAAYRSHVPAFTPNPVCDARKGTEAIVCLTCESRERVDEMVGKAVAAGGSTWNDAQDYGFMYTHGFQDPDGHVWELIWMAPSAMNKR
jgi:predicted lactoylglutathione lyase